MPKPTRCLPEDAICTLRRCYLGLRKGKEKDTWERVWTRLDGEIKFMKAQEDNVVTRADAIGDI
jgi:hypothetical protein